MDGIVTEKVVLPHWPSSSQLSHFILLRTFFFEKKKGGARWINQELRKPFRLTGLDYLSPHAHCSGFMF